MLNELLLLVSECILSAYPLLIKLVDVSVLLQTGLRMVIFAALAAVAAVFTKTQVNVLEFLKTETLATGLLNLVHVWTSYTAFEQLTGGNAMALFYTYPVWNILGASALLNETLPLQSLPWIGVALAGAVALAQPTATNWTLVGIVCALMAALTEAGIYLWFRTGATKDNKPDGEADKRPSSMASPPMEGPWTKMIQMYGGSGVLWAIGMTVMAALGFLAKNVFRLSPASLASIVTFNSLVGFVGYALRFYLVPRVSTVVFSALSFFGIISAYAFDWIFTSQTPNSLQIAGALAIIVANAVLVTKDTV
jgi:drug/metabolite transporter (DMT)-like permease